VGVCPKIVGDTDVTVVADITIGCYRMYFKSTSNEIVAVGANDRLVDADSGDRS
jgi:hypothetical protein